MRRYTNVVVSALDSNDALISDFFVRAGGVEQPIAQWPSCAA
jgi:hypothetical protein